jgi:hypothetical protein
MPLKSYQYAELACYVIDHSGSMSQSGRSHKAKAEEVQEAIKSAWKYILGYEGSRRSAIATNLYVSVVSFSTDAEITLPPTPLSSFESAAEIDRLDLYGKGRMENTDFLKGLSKALDAIRMFKEIEEVKDFDEKDQLISIIFMSDGEDNTNSESDILTVTKELTAQGANLPCAYYGKESEKGAALLQKMAFHKVAAYQKYKFLVNPTQDDFKKFLIKHSTTVAGPKEGIDEEKTRVVGSKDVTSITPPSDDDPFA